MEMDWIDFFKRFFDKNKENVAKILTAEGCREKWVQGQMFLDCPAGQIETEATKKKYDIVGKNPKMVCEIKICGGDYQPKKMKNYILGDIEKLKKAKEADEKYFVLLIDNRYPCTSLGKWLNDFTIEDAEVKIDFSECNFTVRIWKIGQQ